MTNSLDNAFLTCEALTAAGFAHAFFTRRPVDNIPVALGHPEWPLAMPQQTHSDKCLVVPPFSEFSHEGDAIITTKPNIFLGIKTADCLPVLIADPKTKIVAAVHAGWRGTLARITEKTMSDLKNKFGVDPRSCIAALGPNACGDCYEVGGEVVAMFEKEFSTRSLPFVKKRSGDKSGLDVALANKQQLLNAGVPETNIHAMPRCTMHENDLFFSHRIESKTSSKVGRQVAVIGYGRDL